MFTPIHAIVLTGCLPESDHMPTARITKSSVDATHASNQIVMLWDDKISGFGLKVTPAGTKVYLF